MDDDTTSPPGTPSSRTFRRLHQRRELLAALDKMLSAYWQAFVAECEPLAEPALERALERYAKEGPPR